MTMTHSGHAAVRMGKKQFTAQKRGETRVIWLGIVMILSSLVMYFVLGIVMIPPFIQSGRKALSVCTLIHAEVEGYDDWSTDCVEGCCNVLQYPCLQVYVKLNSSEQKIFLYHTETVPEVSPKCSYIPKCSKNHTVVQNLINEIANNFRRHGRFYCYHDREDKPTSVTLERFNTLRRLLFFLFWPTFMLIGGFLVVIMVKISQYFSKVSSRRS